MHYISENATGMDCNAVVRETKRDKILFKIVRYCIIGWPSDGKNLSDEEKRYFVKRNELSVEQDCMFWGWRIVIPSCLRGQLLESFHFIN